MKRFYFFLGLIVPFVISCNSSNKQSGKYTRDSIIATNSTDSSILIYKDGLDKISDALDIQESPVYTRGDYSFYFVMARKDSLPVYYKEIGDSGDYGYNHKTYYLENNDLVLFLEESKVANISEKSSLEFKETRTFFRNGIFLKAEQRVANSDSLLKETPFSKLDENMGEKNPQYDFQRIENAIAGVGDFTLTFDRIQAPNSSKSYLILNNGSLNLESAYLINKPDSLIIKIKQQPEVYKGKSLKIDYKKQGMQMIYNKGKLAL